MSQEAGQDASGDRADGCGNEPQVERRGDTRGEDAHAVTRVIAKVATTPLEVVAQVKAALASAGH